jgi:hypothetical protein
MCPSRRNRAQAGRGGAAIAERDRTGFTTRHIRIDPINTDTIQGWIDKWHPVAARALQAFAPLFDGKLEDAQMPPLEGVTQKMDKYYRDYLSSMGLQPAR